MSKKKKEPAQSSLVDEMPEPPQALQPIALPSAHHFALVRIALTERAATLQGIAKKLDGESYAREARIVRGDAEAITEDILPQVSAQRELPLATAADVSSAIKDAIRGPIFKHCLADDDSEVDHRAALGDAIGSRMAAYAVRIAERAFAAGVQARETTPEALCVDAVSFLYSGPTV